MGSEEKFERISQVFLSTSLSVGILLTEFCTKYYLTRVGLHRSVT